MKVNCLFPVKSLSGTTDGYTYQAYNNETLTISKKYTVPTPTAQNTNIGEAATNLFSFFSSFDSGYIADLETYTTRRNAQAPDGTYPVNSKANYIRMWWAVFADDPTIDLASVTFADISLLGISIQTIAEAIQYGMLPEITYYADLTAQYDGAE